MELARKENASGFEVRVVLEVGMEDEADARVWGFVFGAEDDHKSAKESVIFDRI